MAGRDEALQRASQERLGRLRQQLETERNDSTLFRGIATSAYGTGGFGRDPRLSDDGEATDALNAALVGLTAIPLSAAAGAGLSQGFSRSEAGQQVANAAARRGFGEVLPGVSSGFYEGSGGPKIWADVDYGIAGPIKGDASTTSALESSFKYNQVPRLDNPLETPLAAIDWQKTAEGLERSMPIERRLKRVSNVPEAGPDLGGFVRASGFEPVDGNQRIYTVVPDTNSGRFSQRLLPDVIDKVYSEDARYDVDPRQSSKPTAVFEDRAVEPPRPVPPPRLGELSSGERVALLESMAKGQTFGRNQSATLWGTVYQHPRYTYASGSQGNPEVVVSDVNLDPELETRYHMTTDVRDPHVKPVEGDFRRLGPHWGMTEPVSGSTGTGPRLRRQTDGDVSWRSDLTKARGALSLADVQALQKDAGLPITTFDSIKDANYGGTLERAIESLKVHQGLSTHAEVVEKNARRVPRLGRTTAPRRPADVITTPFDLDVSVHIPEGVQRSYDLPAALSRAGYEPTIGGAREINTNMRLRGEGAVRSVSRMAGMSPTAGAILGLTDARAAETLGTALREKDPKVKRGLLQDAVRIYGENAVVGGVQGAAIGGALRGVGALAPAAAPLVAGAVAATGAALAPLAVADAYSGYLKGVTGEGLGEHWKKFQELRYGNEPAAASATKPATQNQPLRTAGSSIARQIVPQIVPTPKPVMANNSTGVAQIQSYTPPANAAQSIQREASRRLRQFQQNFNPLRGDLGLSELFFGRTGRK